MLKKTLSLFVLMLFCVKSAPLFAQNKPNQEQKREFKFGKILPSEFDVKANGADSAAAAIKLFDVGDCYFEISPLTGGFIYVYDRHVRYKIINKNGYDYANYTIGLQKSNGNSKEQLDFMDGATYNMQDGKIVTSKLAKDAKFSEEVNKNYSYKKFALPNVKEGSIIEFKYRIKSDFIFNLRGWNFQSDIPNLWSEYTVSIPEYVNYKFNHNGYYKINHPVHESINANYVTGVQSTAIKDKFTVENIPALKDEPYISNIDDYRSTLDFELKSTNFPGEFYKDYTGSWPKIVAGLINDENFGGYALKNSYAKANLNKIIKSDKDSLFNANAIFEYVKQNLSWNNSYNYYSSETNPKTIFEKKTGNSADLNLALVSLLKEAKFKVVPVLISTRKNGKHPGYAVISKFDNVVAAVEINNSVYFLDATAKDMPFGMLSFQNLNHEGFFIDLALKNGAWTSTETNIGDERIYAYNLVLDKDNKLKGQVNQQFKGYAGLQLRNKYRKATNQADYLKDIKKSRNGLEIDTYKIENLDQVNEPLNESFEVTIEDNVEETGNLIYFNPFLYERTKENLFKHEDRLYPVDFAHPIKETYRIVVNFPENCEVDKLPESKMFKLPDNSASFSITYFQENKSLMVKSVININKPVYSQDEYFTLKELFKSVVEKQGEQIVLKKKI